MRRLLRGRPEDLPEDQDGYVDVQELRRVMNVPADRMLVQEEPTGASVVLPKTGRARLGPYSRFIDIPPSERG